MTTATNIDPMAALREAHAAWALPANDHPTLDLPEDVREIRCALIEEEAAELRSAVAAGDLVEVADAIGDLLYVVYGAALTFGIPIDEVFCEIHRSNMTKLGADGRPIYRVDGKVLKGPSFEPPELLAILAAHAADPGLVARWSAAHERAIAEKAS